MGGGSKKLNSWFPLSFTMGVRKSGGVIISNEKVADQSETTTGSIKNVAMKLEYTKLEETVKDSEEVNNKVDENNHNATTTNGSDVEAVVVNEDNEAKDDKIEENGEDLGKLQLFSILHSLFLTKKIFQSQLTKRTIPSRPWFVKLMKAINAT